MIFSSFIVPEESIIMKFFKQSALALCLSSATFFSVSSLAAVPESAEPIKIILNNWTSQLVLANISGTLLQKMGYNIEYKPSDTQLQYTAMGNGDMHYQVEVWEGTMKTPFDKEIAAGRMLDAGSHAAVTREDWWFPSYVKEVCPGLPDWQALNDCAEQLATPETAPLGRYLAGPVDWEKPDLERVEALGLKIEVVNAGQASALWAELDAASKRKEPIILFNWTPNWVEAKYPGEFINFPDHDPKCETDASWGTNPDMTYDCGNPKNGCLKKGVWSGLPQTWPCAYELIKNINFSNAQIAEAAAAVDVDGIKPEAAAASWIENHADIWQGWMPACAG
jgi:glycine betaine/proline transport system substrate-binding protein